MASYPDPAKYGGRIIDAPAPTAPTRYPDPAKYGGRIVDSTAPVETAQEPATPTRGLPVNPWENRRNLHLFGQETDIEAPEWLAGAGRGIMDVLQGGKQLGLQAGEQLGIVPEGRTQDYTRQVQAERQAYEQNYGDSTSASVGRFAGSVIPTLPVPGGVAGGALRRAGSAALAGGAVGATEFVPEGGSRASNIALGAATGGAVSGAMSGLGKGINALRGDTIPQEAADVIRAGSQQDVPVYYPDVAGGPIVQKAATAMEEVPLVGMSGPRATQNLKAKEAAERLKGRLSPIAGDDLGDVLQGSLKNRLGKARKVDKRFFDRVAKELDPLGVMPTTNMNQKASALLAEELAKKPGYQDQALIKLLQERYTVDPGYSFTGLKELRTQIMDDVNDFYKGRNSVIGAHGVNKLTEIQKALEADMEAAARNSPTGWKMFRKAAEFHKKNVVPYLEEADIRRAIKTGDADEIFGKFIQAGKGDRAARLYQRLDPEGRAALRFGVVDHAYQKAISQGPQGEAFSPARFAQELERMDAAVKKVFDQRDKDEITGLIKLMRHVQRSGQSTGNPTTDNRTIIQLMLAAVGGAGVAAAPGPTAGAVGGIAALRVLFTTKAGRNLLLSSSRLRIGSPALDKVIANQLPKIASVGAVDAVPTEDAEPR